MKILFVHQNFPGQYLHLARYLGQDKRNEVVFLTQNARTTLPGVKTVLYKPHRKITPKVHHYLRDTEAAILNAQEVARVALTLKESGFVPDVMFGHNGWGEIWYLKDVYPSTPLIGYFEYFYRFQGADVGFDPSESLIFDTAPRIRTKNIGNLLGLDCMDLGQTPTKWQHSLYPNRYQSRLHIIHEGIDTRLVAPDENASLSIPGSGLELTKEHEVITYVARNLEPYRGFPQFMRALPEILKARPQAHVLIVGGNETSYGHALPQGQTHKQNLLKELHGQLDLSRVHFLDKVPYPTFLRVIQVSRVHVYLTYPFVLSWSMLEAMSAGCLVVASRTPPVAEVIEDGNNGLLVDFFSTEAIAEKVINALAAGRDSHAELRQNARQTIVQGYDLAAICLPGQIRLMNLALAQ